MDRFPLPETAEYSYQQRFTLQHLGIDIMAPEGTPVVAVEDGTAWTSVETKGGNVVYLDGKSGTRYFYGHLQFWVDRMLGTNPKTPVKAGDALGYVGNTGNAAGGPTHLHFQERIGSLLIDPFGELQAVDPHPERGRPGESVRPVQRQWPTIDLGFGRIMPAAALLALLWFASKGRR